MALQRKWRQAKATIGVAAASGVSWRQNGNGQAENGARAISVSSVASAWRNGVAWRISIWQNRKSSGRHQHQTSAKAAAAKNGGISGIGSGSSLAWRHQHGVKTAAGNGVI
jgi:hypothetical protein